MKSKIHLNTRNYMCCPTKDFNRQMELKGLRFMLIVMLEQEKYGVAEYVRRRIGEILQQQFVSVEWKHPLRDMKLFLS
jgi:hypothetical protein